MKLLVIALAVTSMALAPSLLINKSADAASHSCEDTKGKSKDWIEDVNKVGLIMIIVMELIQMMESHSNFIADISLDGRKDTVISK